MQYPNALSVGRLPMGVDANFATNMILFVERLQRSLQYSPGMKKCIYPCSKWEPFPADTLAP